MRGALTVYAPSGLEGDVLRGIVDSLEKEASILKIEFNGLRTTDKGRLIVRYESGSLRTEIFADLNGNLDLSIEKVKATIRVLSLIP